MIRKYLVVSMLTLLSVTFSGCATMFEPQQQEVVKYAANFNYTPDSQAAPGSAGVTFAVGKFLCLPSNVPSDLWMQELVAVHNVSNGTFSCSAFSQFDGLKAARDDLTKILMAKGFSIRGPFDSYDLIPYADKKAIDLYLMLSLELSFKLKDEKWADVYYSAGNVEVNGKIILECREIVTRELMWSKSIPLNKIEFPYRIRGPYRVERKFDLIMNEVAKGIEKQYPDLLATISKLIDPEEMRIIKKQCQELKSKKGY